METCRPSKPKVILTMSCMTLVLASSLMPMDRQIQGFEFIMDLKRTFQNLLHIPMYAVVSVVFSQILNNYQFEGWKRHWLVLLLSSCFGILIEVVQIAVPSRQWDLIDIGLNFIGAILGIFIYVLAEKSKPCLIKRIVCI